MTVGRPQKLKAAEVAILVEKFAQYIDENPIPIIAEFAYMNDLSRQTMYDRKEFSTLIKKCVSKKEANLERGTLMGDYVPSMAIFSLKQLGWKDKQELDIKHEEVKKLEDLME